MYTVGLHVFDVLVRIQGQASVSTYYSVFRIVVERSETQCGTGPMVGNGGTKAFSTKRNPSRFLPYVTTRYASMVKPCLILS